MAVANSIGYPRIGEKRELKRALESYWSGRSNAAELEEAVKQLREVRWREQREAGIERPPSNDFSLYDHVLDTAAMLGAVPSRFGWSGKDVDLGTYFSMARGVTRDGRDEPPMEMTKWFDTNYHFIVPELTRDQTFQLSTRKAVLEYQEGEAIGIETRPVLLGPLSFLWLSKCVGETFDRLELLDGVLAVYEELVGELVAAGVSSIQFDEPILVADLDASFQNAFPSTYQRLRSASQGIELCLASYFGELGENLSVATTLPVDVLHIDLVRGRDQLGEVLQRLPETMKLSMGVIDGRNVWRSDLDDTLDLLRIAANRIGSSRILVAPSCSLMHCPLDVDLETELENDVRQWLAFSRQKLSEIVWLARELNQPGHSTELLDQSRLVRASRRSSRTTRNPLVRKRLESIRPEMLHRRSSFPERRCQQTEKQSLPVLPTTTIGSFPQTDDVRKCRAEWKKGLRTRDEYESRLKQEIARTIRIQEELDLDVLVHGEPERNDMVEYFGEHLTGFVFTRGGWVQSYGSRCVKPPIIYGDVSRPKPMTVDWTAYAQSLTDRPVKGMLTGPVTILQWSFVRDDQSLAETCRQIALAIRDEVTDLESSGVAMIQVDEAALREGLPIRRSAQGDYLSWAIESFRLATSSVKDETQLHTHMCYSEFHDIYDAIIDMDADVISIESSRSGMELLSSVANDPYPNAIGPGVYDIHSPRVPSDGEISSLIEDALNVIPADRLWINPDCGLKTRRWPEAEQSLKHMVSAAKQARSRIQTREETSR